SVHNTLHLLTKSWHTLSVGVPQRPRSGRIAIPPAFRKAPKAPEAELKLVEGIAATIEVPAGRRDVLVFDDELPGFFLRKFSTGKATYGVKYNIGAQQRRLSLGAVVDGNLREMRKRASTVLSKARLGEDVVAEKRAATGRRTATLGELAARYLADRRPKLRPRYFIEIERQLERDWRPLHRRDVADISRGDVLARMDEIAAAQGEIAADRARVALSGLFAWAIGRGYCDASPTL